MTLPPSGYGLMPISCCRTTFKRFWRVFTPYLLNLHDLIQKDGPLGWLRKVSMGPTEEKQLHRSGHCHEADPALLLDVTLLGREYSLD